MPLRLIIGVTGASGSIYALRLLEKLHPKSDVEIHLVVSRSGEKTLFLETGMKHSDLKSRATHWYAPEDIGTTLASGSYRTDGMVILACPIHTMSSIAYGISLKEGRKLILRVRETPFHLGHLRTIVALAEMGAVIAPPIPAFYQKPATLEDLADGSVARVLELPGLSDPDARRWNGAHQA